MTSAPFKPLYPSQTTTCTPEYEPAPGGKALNFAPHNYVVLYRQTTRAKADVWTGDGLLRVLESGVAELVDDETGNSIGRKTIQDRCRPLTTNTVLFLGNWQVKILAEPDLEDTTSHSPQYIDCSPKVKQPYNKPCLREASILTSNSICDNCTRSKRTCDTGRPCDECQAHEEDFCSYINSNYTAVVRYRVRSDVESILEHVYPNGCNNCTLFRFDCDGGMPCQPCLRNKRAWCTQQEEGGAFTTALCAAHEFLTDPRGTARVLPRSDYVGDIDEVFPLPTPPRPTEAAIARLDGMFMTNHREPDDGYMFPHNQQRLRQYMVAHGMRF